MEEAFSRVDTLAIPPQQRADRKRMPQMMGTGRLHAGGNRQLELWDELVEDMADGLRAGGTGFLPRDRQEGMRRLERAAGLLRVMEIGCYAGGQAWPQGHQAALREFGLGGAPDMPATTATV